MNAKVVLDGLVLGESPRWHNGSFWVADWAAHELITLDANGTVPSAGYATAGDGHAR